MDSERWQRIETLFDAALDLDPSRWDTFLDERCRDDPALRAEVAALLASHVPPAEPVREPRPATLTACVRRWRWAIVTGVLAAAILILALALRSQTSQRHVAESQRAAAQTTARDAIADGYVHALVAAEALIRSHETDDARRLLEQTPPALRGWGWRHLERRLVAASRDGTIPLWNAQTGDSLRPANTEDVRTFEPRDSAEAGAAMNDACLSRDGTMLAGANQFAVHLWDTASGRHLATLETARADYPSLVAFSPDGSHLFCGDRGGNVIVFDPLSHRRLLAFAAHSAAISGLAVSPGGDVLASAGMDSTVKFWDARNLSPRGEFRGVTGAVARLAFGPDGMLAAACSDRVVRLWNTSNGDTLRVLRGHAGPVIDVAYSMDGTRLVSTTRGGDVRIWDAVTGAALDSLEIGPTDAVCFSPDGGRILAAGAGSSVRVIAPATGREVLRLHGHTGRVLSLACFPIGVVSASADGSVRLWDDE